MCKNCICFIFIFLPINNIIQLFPCLLNVGFIFLEFFVVVQSFGNSYRVNKFVLIFLIFRFSSWIRMSNVLLIKPVFSFY